MDETKALSDSEKKLNQKLKYAHFNVMYIYNFEYYFFIPNFW